MTNGILITVLIPCHSLHYLARSVESISRQTFPTDKFEVLLVADRIDQAKAFEILRKSGLKFRIVESMKPGIVAALNLGLASTTSEFVARMDEDDLMMPERLQLQYQHLMKNKQTLVVGGQLQLIDDEDKVIGFSNYKKRIAKTSFHVFEGSPIAHPASFFRRSVVVKIGGYRDFLPEDWDLWVRLSEQGPIENLRETVLSYRIHPNQLSREKMYAQQLGRKFVSVSHFARLSGMTDAPIRIEDKSLWLEETQVQLRSNSLAFRQFEKRSEKREHVVEAFQKGKKLENLWKRLAIFLEFPVVTSIYLAAKTKRKLKLLMKKAKKTPINDS
jgi:glycosyltransferase involved in cell wall biosynthesis